LTHPTLLERSNANPKMKKTKEGVGVHFLACGTSWVEGRVEALRWGLGQVTSGSIIHIDLHNPNNKLVSAWLEDFVCMDGYTWTHKIHHGLDSRESHHFLPYSIYL
jgi:hypothetical protein